MLFDGNLREEAFLEKHSRQPLRLLHRNLIRG